MGCLAASSAVPILADQIFRRWVKPLASRLLGQGRQLNQGLSASLAGITATGLLQVAESLLAQAAPMAPGPEVQDLVQRIGEIADLQGCHCWGWVGGAGDAGFGPPDLDEPYMRYACALRLLFSPGRNSGSPRCPGPASPR